MRINRNIVYAIGVGIIVLGIAGLIWLSYASQQGKNNQANNFTGPTEQEKQETEEFKKNQQNQTPPPPPATDTGDGKKLVTPVISYVGQYDTLIEASAYIPGILENSGTCTLTVTQGATTVTKTSKATADATTTRCETFSFPRSELNAAGTWSAKVSYDSTTSKGASANSSFEAQ